MRISEFFELGDSVVAQEVFVSLKRKSLQVVRTEQTSSVACAFAGEGTDTNSVRALRWSQSMFAIAV